MTPKPSIQKEPNWVELEFFCVFGANTVLFSHRMYSPYLHLSMLVAIGSAERTDPAVLQSICCIDSCSSTVRQQMHIFALEHRVKHNTHTFPRKALAGCACAMRLITITAA